ncbi:MAG: hypothetical protein ACFFD1_01215 [Candidatus Thorarchaeota archaeon]
MIAQDTLFILTVGILLAYIIAIFGGAVFVWLGLKTLRYNPKTLNKAPEDFGVPKAGLVIGMLERTIILTLGLLNQYGAIAFVILAKTMARFKQLEERYFAEYYLIGTLLSFVFALMVVLVFQTLYTVFSIGNP